MAALALSVFLLAIFGASDAAWCVCRSDVSSTAQQKTIDYACGAGADCSSVLQNGPCYNPNTVLAHCSYAANSYFQNKGQAQGSCDFAGTALITQTDPSGNGCTYPASPSAAASVGSSTQNPGSSTSTGSLTPTSTGTGVLGGLGPSSIDDNSTGFILPNPVMISMLLLTTLFFYFVHHPLVWLRL